MAEQRERLLVATVRVAAEQAEPTASAIVRASGVGRNTFYEFFDDARHAVREAAAASLREIERELGKAERRARTPVERWRELVSAWLGYADDAPASALVSLSVAANGRAPLSPAGELLASYLLRSLETVRQAGLSPPRVSRERVAAVAAAGEALARQVAARRLSRDDQESAEFPRRGGKKSPALAEFYEELLAVAVRLLR